MSRAFVREGDGPAAFDPPAARLPSPHRNLVTLRGLAQIERALADWRDALSGSRTRADLSGVARAEAELAYWSQRRSSAELVPTPVTNDVVRFGSRVILRADDGQEVTFHIVGEDEAAPANGAISWVAPLARALLGCAQGDEVEFQGRLAEIVKIA
jgi:transcription elongation GreA/GreB family factor